MEKCLIDAGWTLKQKQWQKVVNYRQIKLELNMVVRKNSNREAVAQYLKETFQEQGIILNIITVDDSEYAQYLAQK